MEQAAINARKARIAIRTIKTVSDALALRGYYKPSGKSGQTLADGLKMLSPEIYGTMNDPRIIELKGLEYVLERLPKGIEKCNRIILTAQEEFENTSFEIIIPPKRRRTSYRVSEKEICFVITRGISEIYDLLTHLTFLTIEAGKIYNQMKKRDGDLTREWIELEKVVNRKTPLQGDELYKAIWNLSILLGRKFQDTRASYDYLEKYANDWNDANILFKIIYGLAKRVEEEKQCRDEELLISFTPSLRDIIGNQSYSKKWASDIKTKLYELGLENRPLHVISANMHSVVNLLYGYGAIHKTGRKKKAEDLYRFINEIRSERKAVREFALENGLYELPDVSGTHIDCQIIDVSKLAGIKFHPELNFSLPQKEKPVILVMDYAFGAQAFEAMDELLEPIETENGNQQFNFRSISIMGKAGILPGKKGDIMLATSHVFEGTSDNYLVDNYLRKEDFSDSVNVFVGPIVTVFGTSLQNRDLLNRFHTSSWKAVGLEMEGGHYQRAISSAMIRGHIPKDIRTGYAYYASDNPLESGQTLASGSIGEEGIKPTYMITKIILQKIMDLEK
ncbi:MAG: hypothetical protein C4522_00755 [Desulfobacteraceae bacterium]|nr:MAG: hypothetical protein C4522_00755 [Desulfobacteraceae bacterium]